VQDVNKLSIIRDDGYKNAMFAYLTLFTDKIERLGGTDWISRKRTRQLIWLPGNPEEKFKVVSAMAVGARTAHSEPERNRFLSVDKI